MLHLDAPDDAGRNYWDTVQRGVGKSGGSFDVVAEYSNLGIGKRMSVLLSVCERVPRMEPPQGKTW